MAETWLTPRKCSTCFRNHFTNQLRAQFWGGKEYRLTCDVCGHSEMSEWAGRLDSGEQKES